MTLLFLLLAYPLYYKCRKRRRASKSVELSVYIPISERKAAQEAAARQAALKGKLDRAKHLLKLKQKGYRSNPVLDLVRSTCWPKQRLFLASNDREVLFGGAAGGGKVLYDKDLCLTPFGFKKGEDLKVGDAVNAPDGSVARIIQLHPRRKYRVWRVHFHDGTHADVAKEHLWLTWNSGRPKKIKNKKVFGQAGAIVIETQELKSRCDKALAQEARGKRPNWPCIPVCDPQPFNAFARYVPRLDPYLLGMWLGDGHGSSQGAVSITSNDHEHVREHLKTDNAEWSEDIKTGTDCKGFRFTGEYRKKWVQTLEDLGLWRTKAPTKFIPDYLKYGSIDSRLAVLQGLMDTDGTSDSRGQCYYCSISEQLANDVVAIVQSLGGTGTISKGPAWYRDEDGNKIECNDAYHVYIKLPDEKQLFRLKRKSDKVSGSHMYRRVVKVERTEEWKTGRCITVSHPSGLYMTNDFIVTHNSDALLMSALMYVDVPGYSAILFRSTYANLSKSGALMDRLGSWLRNLHPHAQKRDGGRKWIFPTRYADGNPGEPASVEFGYLANLGDQDNYLSAEYQFIGFDECSEIFEDGARALYGRLRRPQCIQHKVTGYNPHCPICYRTHLLSQVPLRFRLATNPGGKFSEWVKNRFIPQEYLNCDDDTKFNRLWEKQAECIFCSGKEHLKEGCVFCKGQGYTSTYFIPSRAQDNFALDKDEYMRSLAHLSHIDRQRMLDGQWNISVDGLYYKSSYFQYYEESGEFPLPSFRCVNPDTGEFGGASGFLSVSGRYLTFLTVDSALKTNENCDYTVIGVWSLDQQGRLFLREILRDKWPVAEIETLIVQTYARYSASICVIEDASSGSTIIQNLSGKIPVERYSPAMRDKGFRSSEAVAMAKEGLIFLPKWRPAWLDNYLSEICMFPNAANDDQFDVTAQAGWYATLSRVKYSTPRQVIQTHDQIAEQVYSSTPTPQEPRLPQAGSSSSGVIGYVGFPGDSGYAGETTHWGRRI